MRLPAMALRHRFAGRGLGTDPALAAGRRLPLLLHPLLLGKVVDGLLESFALADPGVRRSLFEQIDGLLRQPKRHLRQGAFAARHPAGRVSVRHNRNNSKVRVPSPLKSYPSASS